MPRRLSPVLLLCFLAALFLPRALAQQNTAGLFAKDKLAAWCIVPFDAKKRNPEERAAMLEKLGLKRFVYDYRAEHVQTFDAEVEALKRHHVELIGWWFPGALNDEARLILDVIRRHGLKRCDLWVTGAGEPAKTPEEQARRVAAEADRIRPIAEEAAKLGVRVSLYNHGGWFGEPENQLAIIGQLNGEGIKNVGIVYNLHHAHDQIQRLPEILQKIKPHLHCLNLNGMKDGQKILPIGEGADDLAWLRHIRNSGWNGPMGILNHTDEDAEARLQDNLDGLAWLVRQLEGKEAEPKPVWRSWKPAIPKAASFPLDPKPLHPEDWPNHLASINKNRVYDFYAKQALHFKGQKPAPTLLAEFPGLDGGVKGHWGDQNDRVWRDDRWQKSDLGDLACGVLRVGGLTVPKAVCVRLKRLDGKLSGLSACFDPQTLSFPLVWKDGFVALGDKRHGFMDGLSVQGAITQQEAAKPPALPFVYHGYYRLKRITVFSYQLNGVEMLDSVREADGQLVRERAPATEHSTRKVPAETITLWPQILETKGVVGTAKPYAVDTLTLPHDNPYGALFFVSGLDFFANGDAAICTMTGEVWRVSGIDDKLEHLKWKRFATGLHQPLGLLVADDKVHVLGRDQITRLHDADNNGEADFYECVTNAQITAPGGHDFITGLERDAEGRFYTASANQGVIQVTPGESQAKVLATGFRNPNGLAVARDGTITTSAQEGEWTPASMIFQVTPGGFYGHGGPKPGQTVEPPLVYLPRGLDNSCGGQVFVNSERWGPLKDQLIGFSMGACQALLVVRQTVDGIAQGAAFPLAGDFSSGAHRGRFHPADGQLYVGGMRGWGDYGVDSGSFQRLRHTGGPAWLPVAWEARQNGVLLTFSDPLETEAVAKTGHHFAQCWNYRHSAAYGSAEYSLRLPGVTGHDVLEIASARVQQDGRSVFLEIPQINPAHQIHLHVQVTKDQTRDLYLTVHRLGEALHGYAAVPKIPLPGSDPAKAAAAHPAKPNPWAGGQPGRAVKIEAALGLQFAQKELRAKAGERLSLTFVNPDVVPHNWVLLQPGSLQKVGAQVDKMIVDPSGLARHYVPESPDVLCHTDMANPNVTTTIHLTAPAQPGDYPYLCAFPGHWQVMNGVLKVE